MAQDESIWPRYSGRVAFYLEIYLYIYSRYIYTYLEINNNFRIICDIVICSMNGGVKKYRKALPWLSAF